MNEIPITRRLVAVAETLGVLAAAVVLTMLLTVPLILGHMTSEAEFPLIRDPGDDEPPSLSADDLAETLEARGLADHVLVRHDNGSESLVLMGYTSVESLTAGVHEVLAAAGYRSEPVETRSTVDFEGMLLGSGHLALGVQALAFLALGLLMIRFRVIPAQARGSVRPVLAWGVGGGVAAFAVSLLISLALEWVGLPVREQDWVRTLLQNREAVWKLAAWIVLIVPVAEEVFFRGYVLRFLSQRAGAATGLWVSALLFALVHFNPSGLPIYIVIGLILAWVYRRASSLAAPILAHFIHNSLVLASFLAGLGA